MNNVYDLIVCAAQSYAKGNFSELNAFCDRILQIDTYNTDALTLKAVATRRTGDVALSIRLLRTAVAIDPLRLDAQLNLADGIESQNQPDQAAQIYRRVLIIDRNNNRAAIMLARLYETQLALRKAADIYRLLISINPEQPEIYTAIGVIASVSSESIAACRHMVHAAMLASGDATSHYNMALAMPRESEAAKFEALRKAISLAPDDDKFWFELGSWFGRNESLYDELRALQKAVKLAPDNVRYRRQLAAPEFKIGIKTGDFERSWRARLNLFNKEPDLPDNIRKLPIWNGERGRDIDLLIITREGVGDEVMFASCLPDVIFYVRHVIIVCNPRLTKLFRRSFPTASVRSGYDNIKASFRIYMDALHLYYRKTIMNFPSWRQYLVVNGRARASWRKLFTVQQGNLCIGIAWHTVASAVRSVPLGAFFNAFININGITLINLQYGADEQELAIVAQETDVTVVHGLQIDFKADLDRWAAQIAACDLVIGIDTAAAHFAGALGVETWMLLPKKADIRWDIHETQTPWYPAARLYRQKEAGNWDGPLGEIRAALEDRTRRIERTPH